MKPTKQIKTAKVVKRFDTIGQVGWWVVFQADLIVDGEAKPFTYVDRKYATEARANKELAKLVATFHGQPVEASVKSKRTPAQLDREIGEALAKRSATRSSLSPEVTAAFASMVESAETDGAENLFLARRDEGYTGDPKEFRFSVIFARRLPSYKHERIVDYIEQYSQHPHDRLGRKLTASEASRLQQEASKMREEETVYLRAKGIT